MREELIYLLWSLICENNGEVTPRNMGWIYRIWIYRICQESGQILEGDMGGRTGGGGEQGWGHNYWGSASFHFVLIVYLSGSGRNHVWTVIYHNICSQSEFILCTNWLGYHFWIYLFAPFVVYLSLCYQLFIRLFFLVL